MDPKAQLVFASDNRTLFDVCDPPQFMSADELRQGFRDLFVRMYDDASTAWRRETFKRKYRRGAVA